VRLTGLFVREAEGREGGWRRLRGPHGFDGGQLHLLMFRRQVAAFIAEHHHRQRGGQAERGGHRHRALGQLHVAAFQQVPGGNPQHEHRRRRIAGRYRVHEFCLCHGIGQHGAEIAHFHAHGLRIEGRADGILHPAVGDQDPQGREVRADGHQPGGHQVAPLRQLVPAEEEQADEGRLQEEGHQAFDGQRRAEDVAHIMAVVAPVHAELEFHDDARRHAHGEVDAEQDTPELGHVAPDGSVRHHVDRLHDSEDH